MNVKEIIELACYKTNTSKNQYPDHYLLSQLDKVYKRIWRAIVTANEKYLWNSWTTDIQNGVSEYSIQRKEETLTNGAIIPWIAKILKVKLKQGESYEELYELSEGEQGKGWYLADNHIMLSRSPEKDEEDWLMIEGIESMQTIKKEQEELFKGHDDLEDFDHILSLGLEAELWRGKQDLDKANYAKQEFEAWLDEMIRFVTAREQRIYMTKLEY